MLIEVDTCRLRVIGILHRESIMQIASMFHQRNCTKNMFKPLKDKFETRSFSLVCELFMYVIMQVLKISISKSKKRLIFLF